MEHYYTLFVRDDFENGEHIWGDQFSSHDLRDVKAEITEFYPGRQRDRLKILKHDGSFETIQAENERLNR